MILLKWLTFLLGSLTVTLTIFGFLTVTHGLVRLGNSDHVVVSVSIDFPSNSKWDALFYHINYGYSHAD